MFFKELQEEMAIDNNLVNFLGYYIGFKGVSLQGDFKVDYFSTVKIILSFKKQKFFVYGNNLSLKNIDIKQIVVVGDIIATSSREIKFE